MDRPPIYCVEGNIGSGKSTLMRELRNRNITQMCGRPIVYLDEPVPVWESITDENGTNMIELFYGDQEKYAFSFQMMAYISRLSILQDASRRYPNSIILCERSLFTDYFVFAKMLHESGKLSLENYTIYKKWFYHFTKDIHITGIIYIYTNPETAHARCKKRARAGECIELDYLSRCHEAHHAWIDTTDIAVIRLDGNFTHSEKLYTTWIDNLEKFVKSHEQPYSIWLTIRLFIACILIRALSTVSVGITK